MKSSNETTFLGANAPLEPASSEVCMYVCMQHFSSPLLYIVYKWCTLCVHHLYIMCTPRVHHMYTTCTPHVHYVRHIHTTCTLCTQHINYLHHMYIMYSVHNHVHHMFTFLTQHVSLIQYMLHVVFEILY